ncbi:MAG: 3-phosphoglycerate dehydrogenase, partial [Clostridia bacterium]
MYKIGTLNKISPVGLARLTDDYTVVEDVAEANGIILRSYDMHEMELSDNLLAVGRAGAGVNNIPLDKCAEQGIV